MSSNSDYVNRLCDHFAPLVKRHGQSHLSLDWGSRKSQFLRFEAITSIPDILSSSILDVGCGVGHLLEYLSGTKFNGSYIGIDIVEEMVTEAKSQHAGHDFKVIDINGEHDLIADYVLASGIFTFADKDIMETTVRSMYRACRKGIAFTNLSSWVDGEDNEFLADPAETLSFCKSLSGRVALRHDYLPHDFTVFAYKD